MQKLVSQDGPDWHNRIESSISILIVDEFEITRSAMAHMLAMKMPNVNIHVADDYGASVHLCAHHEVDILITDMKRASLRIHDIFERITSARRGIKLILMTGSSDKQELAGVSGMKNVYLLDKPIDFIELIEVAKNLVNQRVESCSQFRAWRMSCPPCSQRARTPERQSLPISP
jgi:DNA-binding NtrC family response regulator